MLNVLNLFLIACVLVFSSAAHAYETDQYETLGIELQDSAEVLNTLIQAEIEDVVERWQGRARDDIELAFDISSRFSRRQLEVWGVDSPHIDSYASGDHSIYNNVLPVFALIQYSKGLAPTISINDVHLGLDKLTHFFGVGALYLHVAREFENSDEGERAAINFGQKVERTYWGTMTTGVYSNADMVANYEGFRFLSGLFTDNTVSGKPALLVWEDGGPRVQRPFDIRDYVNDYWSEVYNPNSFASTISSQIIESLEDFCTRESESTLLTRYVSANDLQLSLRYHDKGLRPDRADYLLPKVCNDFHAVDSQEKVKHRAKHKENPQHFFNLPINMLGLQTELQQVKGTIVSTLCRQQLNSASMEHELLLATYQDISPDVWTALEKQIKLNESVAVSTSGLHKVSSQCYTIDIADSNNIRKGFTLQMRLCLEQKRDGSWHQKKQYIVSFANKLQQLLQDLDPIMLNFFDAQFTHYSSNTMDYFSWDQRVGYVYRTISPLCRWL